MVCLDKEPMPTQSTPPHSYCHLPEASDGRRSGPPFNTAAGERRWSIPSLGPKPPGLIANNKVAHMAIWVSASSRPSEKLRARPRATRKAVEAVEARIPKVLSQLARPSGTMSQPIRVAYWNSPNPAGVPSPINRSHRRTDRGVTRRHRPTAAGSGHPGATRTEIEVRDSTCTSSPNTGVILGHGVTTGLGQAGLSSPWIGEELEGRRLANREIDEPGEGILAQVDPAMIDKIESQDDKQITYQHQQP